MYAFAKCQIRILEVAVIVAERRKEEEDGARKIEGKADGSMEFATLEVEEVREKGSPAVLYFPSRITLKSL